MTFLFPSLFLFKVPPVLIAILLLIATGCFTIAEYNWGVEGRKLEDKIQLKFTKKKVFKIMDLVLLFGSIGLLFIGGSLVVSSVEQLAIITGLSTSFFGLSITAIATSLPELFTTIISKKNKEDKLMMGNILGSNLYNIMLIGGIASLGITSFSLSLADTTIFLFTSLLGVAIIIYFKGKVVPKGIGIILLLLFFLYLLMLRNL